LALTVAGTFVFTSCQKAESGKQVLIGLAMPETHVERWQKDGAALKADAEAKGYLAEVTYGDADQSKQNQQIQDMLTKGAKLLVIGSVNEGVVSAVADAAKDKVIVIAYDRLITVRETTTTTSPSITSRLASSRAKRWKPPLTFPRLPKPLPSTSPCSPGLPRTTTPRCSLTAP